jgi:threonine dehydrogenase-like Zn-dependent dehydrogenase
MSHPTMLAATLVAPLQVEVQEVLRPVAGSNEVVVQIEGCGVCASNIPPFEGREWFSYPMEPGQLGHESWGRITEVGSGVTDFKVGQRVSMLSNHAYAEFDKAEAGAVVALPKALEGQPFPGEPLGCAFNIFQRANIQAGDTVAIVGIGFLGALLTKMAKNAGATVYAISRRPFSLDFAQQFGADELIEMDDHWRIIERVKELTGGRFCDVVIEAVGKQWPLNLSAELCRERGRLVVAGYHQDGPRQINMQLWNWRGLDVINAHEREQAIYLSGIASAAEAVSAGEWNPEALYTHVFPLASLGEALAMTRDRPDGFMKALIKFP